VSLFFLLAYLVPRVAMIFFSPPSFCFFLSRTRFFDLCFLSFSFLEVPFPSLWGGGVFCVVRGESGDCCSSPLCPPCLGSLFFGIPFFLCLFTFFLRTRRLCLPFYVVVGKVVSLSFFLESPTCLGLFLFSARFQSFDLRGLAGVL